MNTLRDAAQQALEALLTYEQYIQPLTNYFGGPKVPKEGSANAKVDAAITALRAALAEPQPEPVALRKVRYETAKGETRGEMAAHCREGDLYRIGDAILVWVNEGDIIALGQRIERAHNIGGDK